MTVLRWLKTRWLPVLLGCLLSAVTIEVLARATPLERAASVGFMLCAILGGALMVLFFGNAVRIDDADERIAALEARDLAVWEYLGIEEPTGWPEEEPEPVEATTDEFPAITEPMRLGDEIETDFRAHQVQEGVVERQVNGFTFRVREEAS